MQRYAASYETLVGMSGLPEKKFVRENAKTAYDFCRECVDLVKERPEEYQEPGSSFASQQEWVQRGIMHGFVPVELGMKIRGFVPKRAYFFGPEAGPSIPVGILGYTGIADLNNMVYFLTEDSTGIRGGKGDVNKVKKQIIDLLRMGYDITLDETREGKKRPIHSSAKQKIADEINAYRFQKNPF